MSDYATPSKPEEKPKKYGKYDDYEIEDAARTLMEAEKIKADKEKMKYVSQCMRDKADHMDTAIRSLGDLREARDQAIEKENKKSKA